MKMDERVVGVYDVVMCLGFRRIGPFEILFREEGFAFRKIGEKKTVELSSGGRHLVIDSPHELATACVDGDGIMIMTRAFDGSRSDDTYPILNFRWVEGDLHQLMVNLTHNNYWGITRNSEGEFDKHDGLSDYIRKRYGGQIPLTIREGASVMGRSIRLHIDVPEELEKLIAEAGIDELSRAIRELMD